MLRIEFTPEAIDDVKTLRKYDQQHVLASVEVQLTNQPTVETRNRKQLRPNQLAEWELRIGDFRVFYDVDSQAQIVKIVAVGYKLGGKLFVHGEEYEL